MISLDDLLSRLRIEFVREGNHHCRAGWIQSDCPFCGKGSKRFHLGWNLTFNYVNCWKCGSHRIAPTLVELTGLSFKEVGKLLEDLATSNPIEFDDKRGTLELPTGIGDLLKPHKRYLKKRDYDPDELSDLWDIGGIGIHASLPWRIFIPITFQTKTISWTTRSISDKAVIRYYSAQADQEEINHKSILYGEEHCRHSIIVHEGCFDVWRTGVGSVATCGTGFSRSQVLRIANYPIRVICFDNEPTAQKRAEEICDLLEPFSGETYNVTLSSKDASEASDKEIKQLRSFLQ